MRPGIITQARMGSTRLPGKVLKPINGRPLLEYHVNRSLQADIPLIVTTSELERDDVIADFCTRRDLPFRRGSEEDLLLRNGQAALESDFNPIIRVTSDCPLIDPGLIRFGLRIYDWTEIDYLYLHSPRTFPHGLDFQIIECSLFQKALERRDARREVWIEWFDEIADSDKKFHLKLDENYSHIRITVDYPDDLNLMRTLISDYNCHNKSWKKITEIFKQNPELMEINQNVNEALMS